MNTPDPLMKCPYDISHQILKSRMQYHLVKCRKCHPITETEICPFDVTHHIPKPEFQYHLTVCPNRRVVENYIYITSSSAVSRPIPVYKEPSLPVTVENWDDELVTQSYIPSETCVKLPILRTLIGATKSQRKGFRFEERRRVQELVSQGGDQSGRVIKDDQPLRLPKQFQSQVRVNDSNMGLGRGVADHSMKSLDKKVGRSGPHKSVEISNNGNFEDHLTTEFKTKVSVTANDSNMGLGRGVLELTVDKEVGRYKPEESVEIGVKEERVENSGVEAERRGLAAAMPEPLCTESDPLTMFASMSAGVGRGKKRNGKKGKKPQWVKLEM